MNKKDYICIDIRCENCNKKLAETRAKKRDNYDLNIKCSKCGHVNKF